MNIMSNIMKRDDEIYYFSVTVGACLSGQPDRPRAAPHPPAPGTPTASSPPSPRAGLTILAEMTLGGPI
ncbi:hypothetical protein T09_12202 [Trichinella sp. T9]|nr:hypothetical protein T09_12202 [Trichinella sp. T9]